MDVILPFKIKNEKKYFDCAFKMGIDEMSAHKFLYITQLSDLDIFPRMGDERLNMVLYLWEICEDYKLKLKEDEWELPEEMETILKFLVPWSLDVWFSKEWERCKPLWKHALIHCLNRARGLLMRVPDMMQINWDFLLLYNLNPWQVVYLKNLNVTKEKTLENGAMTIETEEQMATNEDIAYLKLEQLPLIVLRLVKLFDQSSIDMVKTLCMRVIAAWNKVYYTELNQTGGSRLPYVPPEDKRCLMLICHIYLMATYESDDVKGYVIDNMIYNIRFYNQGFQTSYAMDTMKYTPARFIALTCLHLRLQKREFFDFFLWNSFDTSPVNLFGVVSQAYKSYLLGNILMELNQMNDDDFAANIALYKRLMNAYVNEREKSELFIANELHKVESQRYAHNVIQSVPNMTDFKSKICKGNRMSNIGNYENADDVDVGNVDKTTENLVSEEEPKAEADKSKDDDLRVDPIFQNIPNNEEILYYVHEVLSKKTYPGWHFAKIVLLFKIISHELNMIETWRYHPGLTPSFMLNLETKLSHHYTDLAKIFIDYPFIEQEFWLTAFYLNPTNYNYEAVKRLGIRNNRKRTDDQGRWITGKDKIEAKYGLLSSTIDVKEITNLSNTDEQRKDYEPLFQALSSLRLPASMVKDIITVVFLARNKSFSWAVDWNDLRRRCKMLMSNEEEKKRFVELNMAEANDRLKFLKIDYEKYKNRPQLDYGTIEQGYENLINAADEDDETEESEEEDDFEDDEDVYETSKGRGGVKKEEIVEDDNSQEDDPYLTGKRRTRARAAAAMASILFNSEMAGRRKRKKKGEDAEEQEKPAVSEEKSNDSKSASESVGSATPNAEIDDGNSRSANIPKKNIKECLRERPVLVNPTHGFNPLIDLWNVEKTDLEVIDNDCVSLLESSSVLNRFIKLKYVSKGINPTAMSDDDDIREVEMLTKYEDVAIVIKQEKIEETITLPAPIRIPVKEEPEDVKEFELVAESQISQGPQETPQDVGSIANYSIPEVKTEFADQSSSSVRDNAKNKEEDVETKAITENIDDILKSNDVQAKIGSKDVSSQEMSERDDRRCHTESKEKDGSDMMDSETLDKVESSIEQNPETSVEVLVDNKMDQTTEVETLALIAISDKEKDLYGAKVADSQFTDWEETIDKSINKAIEIPKEDTMAQTTIDEIKSEEISDPGIKEIEYTKAKESGTADADVITGSNVNEDKLSQSQLEKESTQEKFSASERNKWDTFKETQAKTLSGDGKEYIKETPEESTSNEEKILESSEKDVLLETQEKSLSSKDKKSESSGKTEIENVIESPKATASDDNKDLTCQEKSDADDIENQEKFKLNVGSQEETMTNEQKLAECKETVEFTELRTVEQQEAMESTNDEIPEAHGINEPGDNHDKHIEIDKNVATDGDILESRCVINSFDDNNMKLQETRDKDTDSHKVEKIIKAADARKDGDHILKLQEKSDEVVDSVEIITRETKDEKTIESADDNKETANDTIKSTQIEEAPVRGDEEIDRTGNEGTPSGKIETENDSEECPEVKAVVIKEEIPDGFESTEVSESNKTESITKTTSTTPLGTTEPEVIVILDDDEDSQRSRQCFDMPLLDSDESSESRNIRLRTKPCKILIRKLRPSDLVNLRQPKVRVKRVKNPDFFQEQFKSKRRRFERKVYIDVDESSVNSLLSNSSSSDTYHPPVSKTKSNLKRQVLKKMHMSDSDDSVRSRHNVKSRRLSTPNNSTNQSNSSARSSTRTDSGSLVVTPRSASGLKLRISHAFQKSQSILRGKSNLPSVDEIIQLSSSSNDTDGAEIIEIGEGADPLFEEEIVI